MPSVQLRSFGGLNTDSHIQDIRNGDYPDAKNIDHVSISDGQSMAVTPRLGNEYAFDLGEVLPQNKVYVITLPAPPVSNELAIQFYDSSGTNPLPNFLPNGIDIPTGSDSDDISDYLEDAFESSNPFLSFVVQPASVLFPSITNFRSFAIFANPNNDYLRYYDFIIRSVGVVPIDVVVMAEAISESRTGELEVIGSYDLLGDLFVISSPKRQKPIEAKVVSALTFFSSVAYSIENVQGASISVNQEVFVTGVEGAPWANGIFLISSVLFIDQVTGVAIIEVISPTIPPSQGTSIPNTGKMTINPFGLGEIGVATKNQSKNQWTYTRLLRSKELNLSVYNQCDVQGDISSERKSIYFVDGGIPRLFSYNQKAPYVVDGSIKILNPEYGTYSYGNIDDQTRQIQGRPSFDINLTKQIQTGGGLYSGNHRYFARGVLADGAKTDWSLPSNEVPVFSEVITQAAIKIKGDTEGVQTGKANVISISNINSELYQYVEVACVNYLAIGIDTTTYGIFTRVLTQGGVTSIQVTHIGTEIGQDLIPDELSVESIIYTSVKNNEIVDNRYILSNLSIPPQEDIEKLLSQAKYSIKKKQISRAGQYPNFTFGSYQDPLNVFYNKGYMINETYRISARVRFVNGFTSDIFKLFDVTINTDPAGPNHPGRVAGLDSYDLNTTDAYPNKKLLVPYLEISGIDIQNTLIQGVPASNIIERVEFFRAEVDTRTVLGWALCVAQVQCVFREASSPVPPYWCSPANTNIAIVMSNLRDFSLTVPESSKINGDPVLSYDFPFIADVDGSLAAFDVNPIEFGIPAVLKYYDIRFTLGTAAVLNQNAGYKWNDLYYGVYFMDDVISGINTEVRPGDKIVNFGQQKSETIQSDNTVTPRNHYRPYVFMDTVNPQEVPVSFSRLINLDETVLFEGIYVTKSYGILEEPGPDENIIFANRPGYVIKTQTRLNNLTGGNDFGMRMCQIKRPTASQYSATGQDRYIYTGAYQDSETGSIIDVFGGDVFTSEVRYRHLAQTKATGTVTITGGLQQAVSFVTQTRTNPYMVNKQEDTPLWPSDFTSQSQANILDDWFKNLAIDQYFYNNGYSPELIAGYRIGADPDGSPTSFETRVIYSDLKIQGSRVNSYRRFGLLSYTDLDPSFGAIIDMKNVNGELFTLQPNKYQRQFFNTRGTLQLSDSSQIVLGDASVLSRPGVTITSFGCSDKWSVKKGRSQGGDDVLYWYDKIRKKFIRFGSDGAVPLSDRAQIRTLASNGFKWLLGNSTPALDYGIHGIWNQLLSEVTWTCRAYKKPDIKWSLGADIQQGEIVYLSDEINFINFEQTTVLYVALQTHVATNETKPGQGVDWQLYFSRPSVDDQEYYSIRTISFSELKNRFIARDEEPHPRIYLQWQDTYLSPRPVGSLSKVYEHNSGSYLKWYELNGDSQTGEGYIDVVFNIDPNTVKRFISVICNSEFQPTRVELFTKTQQTVITTAEFENQLEQFVAPIPNQLLTGQTTLDNDFMYGQWVKIRFFYSPEQFQRLTNIVLKFNPMARLWNS
jgi:hypothetical protein